VSLTCASCWVRAVVADTLTAAPEGLIGPPRTAPPSTDPATRGTLTVADKVIERIAAIAATQVRGVVPTGSRWDRTMGRALPRADTRTAGSRARLVVEIAVQWPAALGAVAVGVRSAVADQLHALAAIDADGVDVIVVKIVLPPPAGRTS
jgi:uncharacterized alkaline shock family protein YloU